MTLAQYKTTVKDESNPAVIILTAHDVDYIVKSFPTAEIRDCIKTAWKHLNAETEWCWRAYYKDFILACKLAVTILQTYEPKPTKISNKKHVDVESLKAKNDILDIAGRYTKLNRAGANYRGLCPFHSERKPSFFVYPEQQTWHCFGACSSGGDIFTLVMKAESCDFKGAVQILSGGALC